MRILLLVIALLIAAVAPVQAQDRIRFLRDAEAEMVLRDILRPLADVAGLNAADVQIVIIDDRNLNAFVAGGQNIYIHTGLLLEADLNQLQGVLAHELGHITGGHLVRLKGAIDGASAQAALGLVIGGIAAAASGQAGAMSAVVMGSQEMIKRNVLSFTRAQENQADQAGLHFLERAGVSARGMASFLERLAADEARATSASAAHTRTHPLTRDRIDAVQSFVDRSRHAGAKPSAELVEAHQRLQQKLLAYLRPAEVLRKFGPDEASFVGRYARAYALHRRNDVAGAVALLDRLATERPRDAYVQELKGQTLMNANRPAEAVPALRAAALLAPQSALVQTQLAHALIESNGNVEEAVRALDAALRFEPRSAEAWRLSSIAWTRKGDEVRAGLATAEAALARGDAPAARHWATRTQSVAARGSPSWLRADDILRSLSSS